MILPMVAGAEQADRVSLLLTFNSRLNENTKQALFHHLVHGWNEEYIQLAFGILPANFSRSLKALNETNHTVEMIKGIDLNHLNDKYFAISTTQSMELTA